MSFRMHRVLEKFWGTKRGKDARSILCSEMISLSFWGCVLDTLSSGQPKEASTPARACPSFSFTVRHLCSLSQLIKIMQMFTSLLNQHNFIRFEDMAEVTQVMMHVRSPNWRHVTGVHRVDLDWLCERTIQDHSIVLKYVRTDDQLAVLLNKGALSCHRWKKQLQLWQIQTNVHSTPLDSLTRRCAVTVCSKVVRPMSSANNDTPSNVDTYQEPTVHEEEVSAPGNLWRRIEEKFDQ